MQRSGRGHIWDICSLDWIKSNCSLSQCNKDLLSGMKREYPGFLGAGVEPGPLILQDVHNCDPVPLCLLQPREAPHYLKPNSDGGKQEGSSIQHNKNWLNNEVKWPFCITARIDSQLRSGMEFIPDFVV